MGLDEKLREICRGWGIDLERVNGDASWTLPPPSHYLIDRDGIIIDNQTHTDHTRRQEPAETLAALRRLVAG